MVDGLDVVFESQLAPQMIDMHVNGAAFPNIGITPGFLHKLTAAESSVAVSHQCDQQRKFLWS